jgi:hypothetical protein
MEVHRRNSFFARNLGEFVINNSQLRIAFVFPGFVPGLLIR